MEPLLGSRLALNTMDRTIRAVAVRKTSTRTLRKRRQRPEAPPRGSSMIGGSEVIGKLAWPVGDI
jgi:hypothetical protein